MQNQLGKNRNTLYGDTSINRIGIDENAQRMSDAYMADSEKIQ